MIECLICLEKIINEDRILVKHSKCKYFLHKKCFNLYNKCLYCKINTSKQPVYVEYMLNMLNVLIYIKNILNKLYYEINEDILLMGLYHMNFIFSFGIFIYILTVSLIYLITKYKISYVNHNIII